LATATVSLDVSPENPGQYGRELLADLLNHANALQKHWWAVYELGSHDGGIRGKSDYREAVEGFFTAAQVFLDACDEARVRGRRMRLLTEARDNMVFNADGGIEDSDDINRMGGYLAPDPNEVERAKLAEAQGVPCLTRG